MRLHPAGRKVPSRGTACGNTPFHAWACDATQVEKFFEAQGYGAVAILVRKYAQQYTDVDGRLLLHLDRFKDVLQLTDEQYHRCTHAVARLVEQEQADDASASQPAAPAGRLDKPAAAGVHYTSADGTVHPAASRGQRGTFYGTYAPASAAGSSSVSELTDDRNADRPHRADEPASSHAAPAAPMLRSVLIAMSDEADFKRQHGLAVDFIPPPQKYDLSRLEERTPKTKPLSLSPSTAASAPVTFAAPVAQTSDIAGARKAKRKKGRKTKPHVVQLPRVALLPPPARIDQHDISQVRVSAVPSRHIPPPASGGPMYVRLCVCARLSSQQPSKPMLMRGHRC